MITKTLKKNWLQRLIYLLGLIILVIFSFKDGISTLNQKSSIGFTYWYFFILPGAVLLFQVIFNNKVGWLIFISLYGIYVLWAFIRITIGIVENFENYAFTEYLLYGIICLVLIIIGYFFYLLKPEIRRDV